VVVVLAGVATMSKDGCESVDGPIGRSCQTIRNGYDVVVLATLVCIFFFISCKMFSFSSWHLNVC
jgi:hypothetical protein